MKPWIWLRAAALLQAFLTFGHTAGGIPSKAIRGPREQAIFDAMQGFSFDVMGSMRTHWDFYRGFAIIISVNFAILAVLMWLLANLSRTQPSQARPLVLTLLVSEILIAVASGRFFFAGPMVSAILVSVCLSVSLLTLTGTAKVASQVVAAG